MKFYLVTKLTLGIWIDDGLAFDSHEQCRYHANILEQAGMIVICEPRSTNGHHINDQSSDSGSGIILGNRGSDPNSQG